MRSTVQRDRTEFAKCGKWSRPVERSKCRTTRYSQDPLVGVALEAEVPSADDVPVRTASAASRRKKMPSPCTSIRSGPRPPADLSEATELLLRASGVAERCSSAGVSGSRSGVKGGWIPNFLAASSAVAGEVAESGSAYASL